MISDKSIGMRMAELGAGFRTDYSPQRAEGRVERDRYSNIVKVLEPGDQHRLVRCIIVDLTTKEDYPQDTWGFGDDEETAIHNALSSARASLNKPMTKAQKLDVAKNEVARAELAALQAERDRLRAQLQAAGLAPDSSTGSGDAAPSPATA